MSTPKISVIIGVLNMSGYLADAIESVIKQNYPNLELIVMDGGSTDGTVEIIKKYEKYITHWQSGKDKGNSDACNKAVKIATGELISFLNADDQYAEGLLNQVAAKFEQNPNAKMITCGVQIIKKNKKNKFIIDKEIIDPDKLQMTLENMLFQLPVINARFFHKTLFERFGEFRTNHADGSCIISNDREYLIKLALAGIKSEIIPKPLFYYFSHEGSISFSDKNIIKSHKEHIVLAENLLKSNLSNQQQNTVKKWLQQQTIHLFLIFILRSDLKNALQIMKYSFSQFGKSWLVKLFAITPTLVIKRAKKLLLR